MAQRDRLSPRESFAAANRYIARRRAAALAAGREYRSSIRWDAVSGQYYVQDTEQGD